jgi:hypothetical protein
VHQILVIYMSPCNMWTSLGPLQEFDYLNKLDVIGTTLWNFKSPRKLACGHYGPLLSFISLCVS